MLLILLALVICLWQFYFEPRLPLPAALEATLAECEADEALDRFRLSHPGLPATHPWFQNLLEQKVLTYANFLATHPNSADPEGLDYLLSCLLDRQRFEAEHRNLLEQASFA